MSVTPTVIDNTGKIPNVGTEEGSECRRDDPPCDGVLTWNEVEHCSCHISPPCHRCVERWLECPECGWSGEDDYRAEVTADAAMVTAVKQAALDFGVSGNHGGIRYECYSHSTCSMIKRGTCPAGTTREDVEAVVAGTFGGHFNYFHGTAFEYVAYTD